MSPRAKESSPYFIRMHRRRIAANKSQKTLSFYEESHNKSNSMVNPFSKNKTNETHEVEDIHNVDSSEDSELDDCLMSIEENCDEEEFIIRRPNISKPSHFAPKADKQMANSYFSQVSSKKGVAFEDEDEI